MKTFAVLTLAVCLPAVAQEAPERTTYPLDPARPAEVKVNVMTGTITVQGNPNAKEAVVEVSGSPLTRQNEPEVRDGLRRLPMRGTGVEVRAEGNSIRIEGMALGGRSDVRVEVPQRTNLVLRTATGGEITVSNIAGDIEVKAMNGPITMTNVNGGVVAHTMNGPLRATVTQAPTKPLSFSSMNGPIEVTLPASTKANLKVKSMNGDAWTDFDVTLGGDNAARGGGPGRTFEGTLNGGGPDLRFTSMNGKITIRKR
jgi:hypothetical protein